MLINFTNNATAGGERGRHWMRRSFRRGCWKNAIVYLAPPDQTMERRWLGATSRHPCRCDGEHPARYRVDPPNTAGAEVLFVVLVGRR